MYKAVPLKKGLFILLQSKTEEHTKLQKKITWLLNKLQNNNDETTLLDENQQFSVIASKTLLFKKLAERDKTVQKSIDAAGKWETIRAELFSRPQDFKNALKRGVKIRIIAEMPKDSKSVQKVMRTLKSPLFRIRYLSAPIPVKTVIHDGEEVNMCIAIPPNNDVPNLWSNNPQFVKVMTNYFEELWNKATDASETARKCKARIDATNPTSFPQMDDGGFR